MNFVQKKSGEAVLMHTATGSNVKRLRIAASVKKICLKCQNFRITIFSNFSKNWLLYMVWLFPDIYLKFLSTQLFLKIFPKYKKNFLKIACFKSFLTIPLNFLRIFEHMSIYSEFRNTYKFPRNFQISITFLNSP